MHSTQPAPHAGVSSHAPIRDGQARDVERLADQIAELAARLHAATYELLVLLREFDAADGWNCGFLSCAHWLSWRTGFDLGACREKVRVARALAALPRVSTSLRRGEMSYAKVRAITRIATPENEATLLDVARAATAAQVERLVRAWRRVDRVAAAAQTERRHLHRELAMWVDDDGMVVLRGRLTPDIGAVVQRALEAAADQMHRESAHVSAGDRIGDEVTPAQRRADALGRLAESALAGLDRGTAGDRYQVVLHLDANIPALNASPIAEAETASAGDARIRDGDAVGHAAMELNTGATWISAETSRRLSCDAAVVVMSHGADGSVLDVGRRCRTIPPALRRALAARDWTCRFPGCTARRCDAHHIEHWIDGGRTSLANTMLLCRTHHRALHEGGFSLVRETDGTLTFVRPDGVRLAAVPAPPLWALINSHPLDPTARRLSDAGIAITAHTCTPRDDQPLDAAWAIDVLRVPAHDVDGSPQNARTRRQRR